MNLVLPDTPKRNEGNPLIFFAFVVLFALIFFAERHISFEEKFPEERINYLPEDQKAMFAFATGNISYCDLNEGIDTGFTHFYPDRCKAFFYTYNVLKNENNCDTLRNINLITPNFLYFCQVAVEKNLTVCDLMVDDSPDHPYLPVDCRAIYYDDPKICSTIAEDVEWELNFSRREYCLDSYWSIKAIQSKDFSLCSKITRKDPRKICKVVVSENPKLIFENE